MGIKEDILTRVAFSVYSNKSIYALLLGSGISRAAGIPTAWEITMDIINKFSTDSKENPQKWFKDTFGKELSYSNVLECLVGKSEERKNVLRKYFENQKEEPIEPTTAHRSIARLVKGGYIKVIITTNFDRLLEKALEEVGITPQIIKSADDISGATPLVHSDITILKINGDYLDGRFKNTLSELETYPLELQNYIKRILEDYGLISCGWSASWDKGLIQIIRSVANHRYNSFFTYVNKCEDDLSELVTFRKGETLNIESADKFFKEILERVEALAKSDCSVPMSKEILIARLKKYLSKPEYFIEYTDLIEEETKRVKEILLSHANIDTSYPNSDLFYEKWNSYGALDNLISLYITSIRFGKEEHHKVICDSFRRLVNIGFTTQNRFIELNLKLCYLPILILLYVIGIACVLYKKYILLDSIFNVEIKSCAFTNFYARNIVHYINVYILNIDKSSQNQLLCKDWRTPMSTLLSNTLKEYYSYIDDEDAYIKSFCIFEYISALYFNIFEELMPEEGRCPLGEFAWRTNRNNYPAKQYYDDFIIQIDAQKEQHEILQQGMFNGSYVLFDETRNKVNKFLSSVRLY